MSTIETCEYNDLVVKVEDTKSIPLVVGTFTAGMIVTLQDTGYFENEIIINPEDTPAGTELPFSEQEVYVLLEDKTVTVAGDVAVGAIGEFNRASVTFGDVQVEADVAGTLQAKQIKLTDWSAQ